MNLNMTLNGEAFEIDVSSDALLIDVLRLNGFTGTKEGCGVGVCGACTILVNNTPVASCIYLAALAEGCDVWTVEGLTAKDESLLNAFVEQEGMQCGICTPGQVVSCYALGIENPKADEDEIREFMSGNLCRCTGYVSITASVRAYLASK
jgi:aerobic-type carbon monoxide dehydrogenase small subunit (CoxS/CutS family)